MSCSKRRQNLNSAWSGSRVKSQGSVVVFLPTLCSTWAPSPTGPAGWGLAWIPSHTSPPGWFTSWRWRPDECLAPGEDGTWIPHHLSKEPQSSTWIFSTLWELRLYHDSLQLLVNVKGSWRSTQERLLWTLQTPPFRGWPRGTSSNIVQPIVASSERGGGGICSGTVACAKTASRDGEKISQHLYVEMRNFV